MRQPEYLIVVLISFLISAQVKGCPEPKNAGTGGAVRVNFAEAAKSPNARTLPANHEAFDPGPESTVPTRPTTGTRKQAPTAPVATPQALGIRPCDIASLPCPFDGVPQGTMGFPPDPNAAVGDGDIVEVVNDQIRVTDRGGAVRCGSMTLQTLLATTDSLTDPRVQFDNVNKRFSLSVTVSHPGASDTPAMHVAATETADPCGNWFTYRLTFHGDAYPTGAFLDFPMLGQDQNALLLSLRTYPKNSSNPNFTVFGLPKSTIYTGQHVEFNAFYVDSLTAPVTNAGQPTIASTVSFFLAAVPGTGYKLYRLTNSGGAGASLSKTIIKDTFSKPSRNVNQPGTKAPIDPSDGNITSFPYFDGTFIWFVHDADENGFPTVRYGKVEPTKNTVETTFAYHIVTSDDFNPSIAIRLHNERGLNPSLLEGVRDLAKPAGLPVALQHPKIGATSGGAVDKAFAVWGHAEANAEDTRSKVLAQLFDDLLFEGYRVERKQRGAVLIGVGLAGLYSIEQLPILGKDQVGSLDLAEELRVLAVG
jgi:hypothetical protein